MNFNSNLFLLLSLSTSATLAQDCSTSWTCTPVADGNTPVLDADFSEWSTVEAYQTPLTSPILGGTYDTAGQPVNLKCQFDQDRIYFAFEFPGEYRFNATDNEKCAAIGTMFKIGAKATYYNMGGCPDAFIETACANGIPNTCDEYRVDIGAHWELSGTEQSTMYDVSARGSGTGNDPIANKDDEYAVSPYCRFDDNDADADNEWAGAWSHSNAVDGAFGSYHFEMSRKLKTASTLTDAQLTAGETIQFGVAFWDPYQTDDGWTDSGHYVTGCGTKWIDLELGTPSTPTNPTASPDAKSGAKSPSLMAVVQVVAAVFSSIFIGLY